MASHKKTNARAYTSKFRRSNYRAACICIGGPRRPPIWAKTETKTVAFRQKMLQWVDCDQWSCRSFDREKLCVELKRELKWKQSGRPDQLDLQNVIKKNGDERFRLLCFRSALFYIKLLYVRLKWCCWLFVIL